MCVCVCVVCRSCAAAGRAHASLDCGPERSHRGTGGADPSGRRREQGHAGKKGGKGEGDGSGMGGSHEKEGMKGERCADSSTEVGKRMKGGWWMLVLLVVFMAWWLAHLRSAFGHVTLATHTMVMTLPCTPSRLLPPLRLPSLAR